MNLIPTFVSGPKGEVSMKVKIGSEMIITEDFEIKGFFNEDTILVKKGDKGFIDSSGSMHYETGNARGKIQRFNDLELKGYDTENIAKLIYEVLKYRYSFDDFLEDNDLEIKDVIDELDYQLSEIL